MTTSERPLPGEMHPSQETQPQDLPAPFRALLDESRDVSYDTYGEGKILSVRTPDGRTFRFHRGISDWSADVYDAQGENLKQIDVSKESDVEFLEKISSQDIPDQLRKLLDAHRDISYEEYGEKKVVSVKTPDGKTRQFKRASNEYADWEMVTLDDQGEAIDHVDLREAKDTEYLEALFAKDLTDEMRTLLQRATVERGIEDRIRIATGDGTERVFMPSYAEYANWKMETYDAQGEFVGSVDVREPEDVAFLEERFRTLSPDEHDDRSSNPFLS